MNRLSMTEGTTLIGIASSVGWGLGHFGQPHLIVRYMALRSPQDAVMSRRVHITWMILACGGAIMVALVGIAYLPAALDDPESVLLEMSDALLPSFLGGIILAAVLAAVMSTMSSQLLVCSSALVADLYKLLGRKKSATREVFLGRMAVIAVSLIAVFLALDTESLIFELVAFAWAGFGAAFGPVLLLALYWRRFTTRGALAGLVTGALTAFVWGRVDLGDSPIFDLYEIVPGFILGGLAAILVGMTGRQDNPEIDEEFDEAIRQARGTSGERAAI